MRVHCLILYLVNYPMLCDCFSCVVTGLWYNVRIFQICPKQMHCFFKRQCIFALIYSLSLSISLSASLSFPLSLRRWKSIRLRACLSIKDTVAFKMAAGVGDAGGDGLRGGSERAASGGRLRTQIISAVMRSWQGHRCGTMGHFSPQLPNSHPLTTTTHNALFWSKDMFNSSPAWTGNLACISWGDAIGFLACLF